MKQLWYETTDVSGDPDRHRVVAIEYYDGWPCQVVTEEHWNHSTKPWFVPGRYRPTGTVAQHWDFSYSRIEESLFFHNSGGGGEPSFHVGGRLVEWKRTPGRLWVADGIPIFQYLRRTSRGNDWRHHLQRVTNDFDLYKLGFKRLREPLMLEGNGERSRNPFDVGFEGQTVFCNVCDDHRLDDSCQPCEHIHWCDECSALIYTATRRWVFEEQSTCDCPPEED